MLEFETFPDGSVPTSVAARFEAIVRRCGSSVAVTHGDTQLTYCKLNRAANRLAQIIVERTAPDAWVGLLLESDVSAVVAVLAGLKATRIWVPLEPTHPSTHLAATIADADIRLLVVDGQTRSLGMALARQCPLQLVNVEQLAASSLEHDLTLPVDKDAPALIIYTSGSTGTPKGVVHSQRNILHLIALQIDTLAITAADHQALLSRYSHISALSDILRTLLTGASLHIYSLQRRGIEPLAAWLTEHHITLWHTVATLYRQLIFTLGAEEKLPTLRIVHLGGETVTARDVSYFARHFADHCRLLVNLGCTELSTYRQFFIVQEETLSERIAEHDVVPVGYAVPGKEVLIVDEGGTPTAPGDVGEIVVRSPYLALGYWNQPALTECVFLSDPEPTNGHIRRFYTGDLGRMLPDGCLVHLGRKDAQVKILGNRVEPAEIEAVLQRHPLVKEAAVTAYPDAKGDRRLVAYVVAAEHACPSEAELRAHLVGRLPDYMTPSRIVLLDAFPLNSNSKIDRRALPQPDSLRPSLPDPYVAPRTGLEVRLSSLWADVLDINRVGINDRFLDLGGNSLQATRITTHVQANFGVDISTGALLATATIAEMSILILAHIAADRSLSAPI